MKRILFAVCLLIPLDALADWAPEPVAETEIWDCIEEAGSGWHAGATCLRQFSNVCIEDSGSFDSIIVAQCKDAEMKGWDAVLNTAYQSLITDLSGPEIPTVAAEALRDALRAWIEFRDAECLSRGNLTIGTGHYEDGADCFLRVTAGRALDLIAYGCTQ